MASRNLFGAAALVLALVFLAAAKVPAYIEVCGRHDPRLNECVERSVRKLTPRLQTGIAELEVPPIEPLSIEQIVLSDRPDFRALATDLRLSGLSDFAIQRMRLELEQRRIDFQVLFKRVFVKANYEVQAKILVPIAERGPLDIVTGAILAKVSMRFKIVERGSRRYMYFPSMTTSLNISDFALRNSSEPQAEDKPLAQVISSVLTSSRHDIIDKLTPDLETAISAKVLEMANKICKHFTFDELFPDRA